jgi:hypothetical protein
VELDRNMYLGSPESRNSCRHWQRTRTSLEESLVEEPWLSFHFLPNAVPLLRLVDFMYQGERKKEMDNSLPFSGK